MRKDGKGWEDKKGSKGIVEKLLTGVVEAGEIGKES